MMAPLTAYSRRSSWYPRNSLNANAFIQNWIDETTDGCAGRSGESEEGFARSLYGSCMKVFEELYKESCRSSCLSQQEQHRLKEDLGKLFLWGDGFADKTLDRILGQSLGLRNTVLGFIASIGKLLTGSVEVLAITPRAHQEGTFSDHVEELNILIERAESIIAEGSHTRDDDSDTDSHSDASVCSSSDVFADISSYILCLMDLVPTMEQTLSHILHESRTERLLPTLPMLSFQVSEPARTYAQNILDRFPCADIKLIERLGEVNWQRHMRVRRRMKQTAKTIRLSRDSGIGPSLASLSTPSASTTSDVTFETGNAERQYGRRIVLPTPDLLHIECKVCGEMLENIMDDNALELHILAELEPYCCTFSTCKDELLTFPTHKLWVDHELSKHQLEKVWHCDMCADTFNDAQLWREHVGSRHDIFFSAPQFHLSAALAEKKMLALVVRAECPLCLRSVGPARRAFATHVGKHMEDIALTALPPDMDSDTESGVKLLEDEINNACTEDKTENIAHQLELDSHHDTVRPVESEHRGGDVLGIESLTPGDPQKPPELRSDPSSTLRSDMVTLQSQDHRHLNQLPPSRTIYQEHPQGSDHGGLTQHVGFKRPAPKWRLRTTVSCEYCRTRQLYCSGFVTTENGRCTNCHLSQQECIFTPVCSQAFVPAYTAYPVYRCSTELSTEGYPFNMAVPGARMLCSVFVLQAQKSKSRYKKLPDTTILQSLRAMFLCMGHEFPFHFFQVLKITIQCNSMEEAYLIKRNDTDDYYDFIRTSKALLENELRHSKNNKCIVDFFIELVGAMETSPSHFGKDNEGQKTLDSLPSPLPRLGWSMETIETAEELATPQEHDVCSPQSMAANPEFQPNPNLPERNPNALPSPQPDIDWDDWLDQSLETYSTQPMAESLKLEPGFDGPLTCPKDERMGPGNELLTNSGTEQHDISQS